MTRVDRTISETELTEGYLQLAEKQARDLLLPEFSGHVAVRFESYVDQMFWDARTRRLTGESVLENIQLSVSVGAPIRWARDGELVLKAVDSAFAVGDVELASPGSLFDDSELTGVVAEGPASAPSAKKVAPRVRKPRRSGRAITTRSDYSWPVRNKVGILKSSCKSLASSVDHGGWDAPDQYALRMRGEELARVSDFDQLISVNSVRVEPMEHQYAAAIKALREMRGTAILADEVGLGKTIEAGLIAKELNVRGLAENILIIVPAPLREQWQEELREKFGIEATLVTSGSQSLDDRVIIMSRELARNRRQELHEREWDLLIADEAHKLAGKSARATRHLIDGLRARYRLFLTATPVQNDLTELYRLVNMVRPGTLGTERDFKFRYMNSGDPRQPLNPEDLRQLVSQVMIRTTRAQAGLDKVKRFPVDVAIDLPETEKRAYDLVLRILRTVLTGQGRHLQRDGLAKRLTMSPTGLYERVRKAIPSVSGADEQELLEELAELASVSGPTARQRMLTDLVRSWTRDPDKGKALVFTQETRVLSDLVELLASEGIEAVAYHGGLGMKAKTDALTAFKGPVDVMVSTESGAEGLNLQHANAVINYDLPWNPMRIEQRIGRVHRVTQRRDVHVANFYARGTVDENVYRILKEKLRMFELLFGQITTILGELGANEASDVTFEGLIKTAIYSQSDSAMQRQLKRLEILAEQAWERVGDELADSGGVSSWMSPSLDYRASIATEARELKPEEVVRDATRLHELELFARDWLTAVGASIDHESDDFLAVTLPPEMAERMGGDILHLAFSQQALVNHPAAELFAVGSPIFEDFLDAVSEEGDLVGYAVEVPSLADTVSYPPVESSDGWFLKERLVDPLALAGFRAKWLVSESNARLADEVLTITRGDFTVDPAVHRVATTLGSSDAFRAMLATTGKKLAGVVETDSLSVLEEHQDSWQDSVSSAFEDDRTRHLEHLREQQEETYSYREQERLAEQISQVRKQRPPRIELRAELLGVEFVSAATVNVEETWIGPSGVEVAVAGSWSAHSDALEMVGADGLPLRDLGVCASRHPVDGSALIDCRRCGSAACSECKPKKRLRTSCGPCARSICAACLSEERQCLVCRRDTCRDCMQESGRCVTCEMAERLSPEELGGLAAHLCAQGLAVWRGQDEHLTALHLLGHQRDEVVLLDGDGGLTQWWTRSDVPPELLGRAIVVATQAGLGGNITIESADCAAAEWPVLGDSHLPLTAHERRETVWRADGRTVDPPAGPAADGPEPAPEALRAAALGHAIPDDLTDAHHLRLINATARMKLWLDEKGLHSWESIVDNEDWEAAEWRASTQEQEGVGIEGFETRRFCEFRGMVVRDGGIGGHRALVISTGRWSALDQRAEVAFAGLLGNTFEGAWVEWLSEGGRADADGLEFRSRLMETPSVVGLGIKVIDDGCLTHWHTGVGEIDEHSRWIDRFHSSPSGLLDSCLQSLSGERGLREVELEQVLLVLSEQVGFREHWVDGSGTEVVVKGQWNPECDSAQLLDAYRLPITRLAVCESYHPTDLARLTPCCSCNRLSCASCSWTQRERRTCERCGGKACPGCLSSSQRCAFCHRAVCDACLSDGLCLTCLAPDTAELSEVLRSYPWLHPVGLELRVGCDDKLRVLQVIGSHRREIVVESQGGARDWYTLNSEDADLLPEALAIAKALDRSGDISLDTSQTQLCDPPAIRDGLMLRSMRGSARSWSVDGVSVEPVVPVGPRPQPLANRSNEAVSRRVVSCRTSDTSRGGQVGSRLVLSEQRIWLDEAGIHLWSQDDQTVRQADGSWRASPGTCTMLGGWPELPMRLMEASAEGVRAELLVIKGHRLLRVTGDEISDQMVFDVDGALAQDGPLVSGLRILGQLEPIVVHSTIPEGSPVPAVYGREGALVRSGSAFSVLIRPQGGRVMHRVLGSNMPATSSPTVEGLQSGTSHLQFIDALVPAPNVESFARIDVGWHFESPAPKANGQFVTCSYDVFARDGVPGLFSSEGVPFGGSAKVCDEGHLAHEIDACAYCNGRFCQGCEEGMAACLACAIPACVRCLDDSRRCAACACLKARGRFGRRNVKGH